jgi:hypothetical protein
MLMRDWNDDVLYATVMCHKLHRLICRTASLETAARAVNDDIIERNTGNVLYMVPACGLPGYRGLNNCEGDPSGARVSVGV